MNEELTKLLGSLIQNPEALKGLSGSIMPSAETNTPGTGELEASVANIMSALNSADDRRINLLTAVKPFMSPTRASGIDKAIQLLKLTKLTEVMRTERK